TASMAFAIIRPDEIRYRGLGDSENNGMDLESLSELTRYGAAENWDRQQVVWEQNLSRLAEDFRLGKAEIDPVQGDKTCRSCHLASFCRVKAARNEFGEGTSTT